MRDGVYFKPHYRIAQGKPSTYNGQHGDGIGHRSTVPHFLETVKGAR